MLPYCSLQRGPLTYKALSQVNIALTRWPHRQLQAHLVLIAAQAANKLTCTDLYIPPLILLKLAASGSQGILSH